MSKQTYVAFLRGIGPGNPNMRNDKLRAAFESLGFRNVRSVISSGNIIFETLETNPSKLEATIETGLFAHLGIRSPAVVRTEEELRAFLVHHPFGERVHGANNYLMVTFLKDRNARFDASMFVNNEGSELIAYDKEIHAICYIVDMHSPKATNVMNRLERQYNKATTGRTWKTIERVVAKLSLP